VGKEKKRGSSSLGTRVLRDSDTGEFVTAARAYSSSNSASKEIAKTKLKELGIVDSSGKPGKHYR
jgi:hypothetical protein